MTSIQPHDVVVTGIGLATPLGCRPEDVLSGIAENRRGYVAPKDFDVSGFDCPFAGIVDDSQLAHLDIDRKSVRLMGRDAFLATAAARLAMEDSGLVIGRDVAPEDTALFGATGLAGMPFSEIEDLVRNSDDGNGRLDQRRFGSEGLRRTRPLTSFKILSNMPICFVSIAENITGPNMIFNPWEGQGALAIVEGIRHIRQGKSKIALVGGCDYKCHNIAFFTLQQYGLFDSWKRSGNGLIPGEGAAFITLERYDQALLRKARIYALISGFGCSSDLESTVGHSRSSLPLSHAMEESRRDCLQTPSIVFTGCDGDPDGDSAEEEALTKQGLNSLHSVAVKKHTTNLFAAAAAVNLAVAAFSISEDGRTAQGPFGDAGRVALVDCFGPGSEKVSFMLEAP